MKQDEISRDDVIEMARQADVWVAGQEPYQSQLEAFAKLVEERTAAKVRKATLEEMIYEHPTTAIEKAVAYEREHWKEIVEGQLRCITALNDIVGGEGSTTTKNILDYSRMEERIKEAVLEERKACLKICEAQAQTNYWEGADVCAEDIRARSGATSRGKA
jgi:uncharacterized protein YcaQ